MPTELNLSLEEGETKLSDVIEVFAKEVDTYATSSDGGNAPQLAIKATAGLGKTTQIIKKLISYSALNHGDVHYYVPSHRLSEELVVSLTDELDFEASEESIFSRVSIVAGRGQKGEDGLPLCQKSEVTDKAAKAGLNVEKNFCKNKDNVCEFYNNCAYQKQFESEGIELEKLQQQWSEKLPSELFNAVTVMTHANLFLQTTKRLIKPSLIVVDESFYQSALNEVKVNSIELYKGKNPISNVILGHLIKEETGLLSKLRELDYSSSDLMKEADSIEGDYQDDEKSPPLSPSLNSSKQSSLVDDTLIKKRASLILRAIAQEMAISNRDECHGVSYDHNNDLVVIHERKELTIPDDVPTVFIDADAQELIIDKLRKEVRFEKIDVKRLATFHQATDLTFSKNLLLNSNGKTDKIQCEIKAFIRLIAKDGPTLVVCSKSIRAELVGEDKRLMEQESQLEGATVIHFGNLRGLNEYSDYQNVIILGREQPPAVAIENNARSLFWDDNESIRLLSYKGKYKPFENEDRLIYLKEDSNHKVSVQFHPDKRVQLLLEQIRESESLQSMDRLRLLRPHKYGQRNVYLFSSVPLEIPIDNLFSWTQLQKLVDLLNEAKGIIPLNPKHLMEKCPKTATSKATAERLIKELKDLNPLINIYIREMRLFSISYRITNKGKYSKALVSKDIDTEIISKALSLLLGIAEVEIKEGD